MSEFRQKVWDKAEDARSCYVAGSTDKYSKEEFTEMMFLDACLVLAFIEAPVYYHDRHILIEIAACLGIQGLHAAGTDIFNLLENQIPFLVLETVMNLKYGGDLWMEVLDMFSEKLSFRFEDSENGKAREICEKQPLHLLEYFWLQEHVFYLPNNKTLKSRSIDRLFGHFLSELQSNNTLKSRGTAGSTSGRRSINRLIHSFRSVGELKRKGIHFRPSNIHLGKSLEFKSFFFFGLLKLPPLVFTPEWIIKCSNFVAYELGLNDPDNLPTMAYVNFMKSLINRPDDVKELRSKAILFTTFTSDEQVVENFNGIITSMAEDFTMYYEVEEKIQEYYQSKLKAWIAEWLHNYFISPWTFVGVLAATCILVLTFLQTYFTNVPSTGQV